jgi:uncharacterized RDD family membrane protein YckC
MTTADEPSTESRPNAGVFRRLGAMFYDSLAVIAIMMVVYGALEYAYRALLVIIIVLFFGVFWTRRGQTLGMAAWRLKIEREDGSLLRWSDVLKRLVVATVSLLAVGVGYFWIWIDRERLAWPDRWTGTRVVVLPKRKK